MAMPPLTQVRILVVDDSQVFRRFVSSRLQEEPNLPVICEVSDGLEAVLKAEELHPDLILLDIGLPKLNGIEAAKKIHKVAPASKILFLTLNSDPDVVRMALSTGAKGYVLKRDAERELLPAIEAVVQGKQYVSSGMLF